MSASYWTLSRKVGVHDVADDSVFVRARWEMQRSDFVAILLVFYTTIFVVSFTVDDMATLERCIVISRNSPKRLGRNVVHRLIT